MRAWVVTDPQPIAEGPLSLIERDLPAPTPGEVRVRVAACGVCRTDLHLAEGDLPPRKPETTPGHEAVGTVDAVGPGCRRLAVGDRVGVPWLRSTCGTCRWCRTGAENLCPDPTFTSWDADGGYAEALTVPEAFAYRLPDTFDDLQAAPLLCAGIIGYRALRRAAAPAGGRLGIWGFGASAHLAAQVAVAQGLEVHVCTRSEGGRRLALDLGAASATHPDEGPPVRVDAAVLFAPVGHLVPPVLEALERGGTLAIAGVHLSDVPPLGYERHLFYEKTVTSVTANTRADGEAFLALAARLGVRVAVQPYPFEAADRALADLADGAVDGAAVLTMR